MNQVIASFSYEEVAKVCHQANKAYCETQGDYTQVDWENAPDWQKESAITGVRFHILNEHTTPADSHKSWLKEKIADGWNYGKVKDPEKKEHPCIVNYEDLPKSQQVKDYIFKAIVDAYKQAFIIENKARALTEGEELVGITFNPSFSPLVDKAKRVSADLIDLVIYDHNVKTDYGNKMASWNRNGLRTAAITAIVTAQMAVVKILTWSK